MIVSVDPTTGAELARFTPYTAEEVDAALAAAVTAQRSWRSLPVTERCGTAARIRQLITDEMGKPIAEADAEIEKCAVTCEHYAAHAPEYLAA